MASTKPLHQALAELRGFGKRPRRLTRSFDAAPLLCQLLAPCKTLGVEERANGFAFRLQAQTENAVTFSITCLLQHSAAALSLTSAEQAVADQLCEGRTLAQIAQLRGVSANTVKSQVRQIFRKLNVESRVALVRKWCP